MSPPHPTSAPDQPPPRKKSKWDDDPAELAAERERKRVKKAALTARLATEKELASSRGGASPSASASASATASATSREGTPAQLRSEAPVRIRRIPKRGREAHPLLESCRSVYSYEVRLNDVSPFSILC